MKVVQKEVRSRNLFLIYSLVVIVLASSVYAAGPGLCDASEFLPKSEAVTHELLALSIDAIDASPSSEVAGTIYTLQATISDEADLTSVAARLYLDTALVDAFFLYDDGVHGDGAAHDGVYGNTWDSTGADGGHYRVDITASNEIGQNVSQSAEDVFEVTIGNCVPMHNSGDQAQKLDIVFVPCDYSAGEGAKFATDAQAHFDELINFPPFDEYGDKINAYYVNRPGELDCTYSGRCIYIDQGDANAMAGECGSWDTVIALADSTQWAGCASFGGVARSSSRYPWITVHEFGHSFGLLGDEYSYGGNGAPWSVNCDYSDCDNWDGVPGTGCHSGGCTWDNLYRSTADSTMRSSLHPDFGPFNTLLLHQRLEPYS